MTGALTAKYNIVSTIPLLGGLELTMQTEYSTCKDMQDYISTMTRNLGKFAGSLGEKVRIHFLLYNLGETWDTFRMSYSISQYDGEETTYDKVATILIQEELQRNRQEDGDVAMQMQIRYSIANQANCHYQPQSRRLAMVASLVVRRNYYSRCVQYNGA